MVVLRKFGNPNIKNNMEVRMKFTVKTTVFQELMLKAIKGASCNKLSAITNYVYIEHKDNVLSLTTTDGTQYLKVSQKDVPGTGFNVVIDIGVLSKLVLKMTSDTITLDVINNNVIVTGNGRYEIALPLDVDGEFIVYPNIMPVITNNVWATVSMDGIRSVLATNKSALATTLEIPTLTTYYFGKDKVISSNGFVVCANKVKTFETDGMLLYPEFVELLSIITDKTANVIIEGENILVKTDSIFISGKLFPGVEEYPIDNINQFLTTDMYDSCVINKVKVLEIIDRLLLFVDPSYDENGVYLNFTPNALIMSSKKNQASETIKYEESGTNNQSVCLIDVTTLKSQLNAQPSDKVKIFFGTDESIKLFSDSVTQIIALYGDETPNTNVDKEETIDVEETEVEETEKELTDTTDIEEE